MIFTIIHYYCMFFVSIKGLTPLHKAVAHGQVEVIDVLIRNNAEVNATDNNVSNKK